MHAANAPSYARPRPSCRRLAPPLRQPSSRSATETAWRAIPISSKLPSDRQQQASQSVAELQQHAAGAPSAHPEPHGSLGAHDARAAVTRAGDVQAIPRNASGAPAGGNADPPHDSARCRPTSGSRCSSRMNFVITSAIRNKTLSRACRRWAIRKKNKAPAANSDQALSYKNKARESVPFGLAGD